MSVGSLYSFSRSGSCWVSKVYRPAPNKSSACPSRKKMASWLSWTMSWEPKLKSSMGCFQISVSLSPSYLMMLARPSFRMRSVVRRSCTLFSKSHTGQMYVATVLVAFSRTPHWAQENSSIFVCSAMVLMGSPQTGHLAFSPLDWSKTTSLPQWGHFRAASLSVRTLIV